MSGIDHKTIGSAHKSILKNDKETSGNKNGMAKSYQK